MNFHHHLQHRLKAYYKIKFKIQLRRTLMKYYG